MMEVGMTKKPNVTSVNVMQSRSRHLKRLSSNARHNVSDKPCKPPETAAGVRFNSRPSSLKKEKLIQSKTRQTASTIKLEHHLNKEGNAEAQKSSADIHAGHPHSVTVTGSEGIASPMSENDIEDVEDQEVNFIDGDMRERCNEEQLLKGVICEASILETAGATQCEDVYEVTLSTCCLEKIYNLEKFVKLRVLDLSCNCITKIEHLEQNKDLREIKLYDNRITEISGLERLEELCSLHLQHNRITSIGKGFAGKRKLKTLRLDSNRLNKMEAKELAPLSQLTSLDLSNNRLESLTCLNALPALEELQVTFNKLKAVQDLGRCKQLKEIDLSHNQLSDLSGLKGLSQLMVLAVSSNLLRSSSLKALGKLRCLQSLDVSKNRLTDLSFLPDNFPSLEVLNIAGNRIESWSTVTQLRRCTNLTELTFENNPFTKENEDNQIKHHQEISSLIPSLELVDGTQMKKHNHGDIRTPIMRPMSASSALSSRQVENQLKHAEQEMASFSASLSEKFHDLRLNVSTLPAELPERSATPTSRRSVTPGGSRPGSRCNSRNRIIEAQAFAAVNFEDRIH